MWQKKCHFATPKPYFIILPHHFTKSYFIRCFIIQFYILKKYLLQIKIIYYLVPIIIKKQPQHQWHNHRPPISTAAITPLLQTNHYNYSPISDQPKLQQKKKKKKKKNHNQREAEWKADREEREEGEIVGGLGVRSPAKPKPITG